MKLIEAKILCREVSTDSGSIAVYEVPVETTDEMIFKLRLRGRVNPELNYFVVNAEVADQVIPMLQSRTYSTGAIENVPGVVALV